MAEAATSAGLDELIDPAAPRRLLADGFLFTEGPAWSGTEHHLVFSDIPADSRWRWSAAGGAEEIARPTFKGNGMAYERDGSLLVCESVTSCLVRLRPQGEREIVAFHFGGKYLNSPNDIAVRSDGSIYFTDPSVGRWNNYIGCKRDVDLEFRPVFRVPPGGGALELVVAEDESDQPNGLCFSPDERVLYVNDTPRHHIKAFDVAPDGSLSRPRVFFEGLRPGEGEKGLPDGMKCDELGNVWCSGPRGVWVITPDARLPGIVEVPEPVGNLAWGGEEHRTLFLTSSTSLYAVETHVAGERLPGS
ncbi:MAG TPA: SMP-30/gluconolactonase/LRE family protein [Acidimicrobiales bacterium]|nr:SMP-30/gluconolactonase/LRE family protein [Acidimicrobiales bacterium]